MGFLSPKSQNVQALEPNVALDLHFARAISMIYVFIFKQKQIWRQGKHEENVSTKQQQTKKGARLQRADVDQRRSAGA
jgi:hypothetical protein